ncbi:MAG: hypothetical protein B7Z63_05250 [Ignavibacteriae bacterium 37-53-5]|nr:MAG: hypothetical protein B7Z63_05250 [Ignavibacteriae bacterium 37-53-5]
MVVGFPSQALKPELRGEKHATGSSASYCPNSVTRQPIFRGDVLESSLSKNCEAAESCADPEIAGAIEQAFAAGAPRLVEIEIESKR